MTLGIDEAGRGALAGPLVVAGVILHKRLRGLRDSKLLTPLQRERLYEKIVENSDYEIVFTDNETIDSLGLSAVLHDSILRILERLHAERVVMDGNTTFGIEGIEALVGADRTVGEVSAASILAKVSRDRFMVECDRLYPEYGFSNHKGYGTKAHLDAIEKYGYSPLHRKSFRVKRFRYPTLF